MTEFKIPDAVYTKLLEKYRPSSIQTLTNSVKRVLREGFDKKTYDIAPFMDVIKVKEYLNSLENKGVRKTLLVGILGFLRAEEDIPEGAIKEYQKMFNAVALVVETERQYQEPTEQEKKSWRPWKYIKKVRRRYKLYVKVIVKENKWTIGDKYTFLKYVLLCLYTYIPPLRGEEYTNAIAVSVKNPRLYDTVRGLTGRNIFDLNGRKFVVYEYKKSEKYGTRTIDIPEKLCKIVQKWILRTGTNLLVPNLRKLEEGIEVPIGQESLTQMFFKIFYPDRISTSMLRKIYISYFLERVDDVEERKELARIMGHSLATQEFEYSRFKGMK